MHEPLPGSFYARDVVQVAHEILGKRLVRVTAEGVAAGRIVEVEAYLARDDPANHAHRGQTRRNASMFGPPGHAYVYAIHARFCLNVVTEPVGVPSAVLIRAVEPLDGVELMRQRRGTGDPRNLTRGPARLCEAFAIDRSLDGWDLTRGEQLWLTSEPDPGRVQIATATRVGVTAAQDLPLRFFITGNPFASKPARAQGGHRRRSPRRRQSGTASAGGERDAIRRNGCREAPRADVGGPERTAGSRRAGPPGEGAGDRTSA